MNKCEVKIGGHTWTCWLGSRGKDALGYEPDEMLKDRIERSLANYAELTKGKRLPYEPRQGPVYRDPVLVAFEAGLQELCERLSVELHVTGYEYDCYLAKNSSAPRAEIVLDEYVKDCRIYEVNTDGPDGPREGFDE